MSKHSGDWRVGLPASANRKDRFAGRMERRLGFESLEQRQLLTVATPTSIVFQPQSGQGTAALTGANNASTAQELNFLVSGVTAGDTVNVYVDGTTRSIATGVVASGATTITVTSTGTDGALTDGSHTFAATQTDTSSNVSASSPSATVNIFGDLAVTQPAVSAVAGQPFTYTAQSNVPSGDTATIAAGSTLLPNMTFDSSTNTFSGWTPTTTEVGTTQSFTVNLSDTIGNTTTVTVFVAVSAAAGVNVLAPPSSIAIGSPVLVAFNTTNTGTPNFSVTTSNNSQLTATLLPATNQVLQIDTSMGVMDFQLLNNYTPNTIAHIESLINSGTYNTGADFYRIIQNFVDQGGVGGTGSSIPVELNPDLRFTSSGLLAMANDGVDGNGSEFFVTNPDDTSDGFLDFRYTIFGKLISGDNVRQAIAATPVTVNPSSGETSEPLSSPKILSLSIVSEPDTGVLMLKAASGATGSYTVTVSDGLGGSQSFSINVGTNSFDPPNPWVAPINGTDTLTTTGTTPITFTPQGESANNTPVQVSAQLMVPLVGSNFSSYLVDNSYTGTNPPPVSTNPNMTLTASGSGYKVTASSGFYGVQVVEVMGFSPISGTFELQVGSTTTAAITFDSTNLAATAANIQAALRAAGFTGTTVTVATSNTPPAFNFNVTFSSSQAAVTYQASATALPVTFTNSATAATATQELTFTATGTSWDSGSNVNPVYRAFVPVYVDPPAPTIASISAGGSIVTGNTLNNNSSTASELSFNITGAVAGATVSVYIDGGTTPIATGTVGSSATTVTVTTNGTSKIASGSHTFTVVQSLATPALSLLADWTSTSSGLSPGSQFPISAGSVTSTASAGVNLSVGLTVLAPPISSAQVGVLYTYVVQTNAPSGDTVTVTPVTLPAGMVFTAPNTFNWTPTNAQLNTSPTFSADLSDSFGNTATIGPLTISVIVGLAPTEIPVNATSGGNVTVLFSGNKVQIYNNVTQSVLSSATFKSSDTIEIDAPAGQSNKVTVMVPNSSTAPLPQKVFVNGVSGGTNNSVTVYGANSANAFNLNGATVTDNSLPTQIANVQNLTLTSPGGNAYYTLTNSIAATTNVVAMGGNNTLDFSHDTAGVNVNLGLNAGQLQYITPWNNNLSIKGVISFLTGSQFADVLIGGPAATTFIRSGMGNDKVTGGSGDNVLMGGGGDDIISGGPGKNLIIAGMGSDMIFANGWENMIFGGVTSWNSNNSALLNLLAQGSFAAYGYSYRRALASVARTPSLASSLLSFQDSERVDAVYGSHVNDWLILGKYDRVNP
jgi:cyclophilin family peptidyl-prolyl cis-trans isomerase